MYQWLSEGCTSRQSKDDPKFCLSQNSSNVAFEYNNENINIDLPVTIFDVDGHEELDPNDKKRINITRDGE